MAVHNGEAFLGQSIESVLAQTFADFEFIVVDDGSTDGTESLLRDYSERDPRLKLSRQPNAGYVAALNAGCAVARGEFIARIDADDLCEPGRFARQVEFLDSQPEVAVVGGALLLITAGGRPFYVAAFPEAPAETRRALEVRSPVGHPTVLMRRSAFEAVGGYRAAFVHAEDYDLWLRIVRSHEIANLPDILGRYRIHPDNASHRNLARQAVSVAAARAAARLDEGAPRTFAFDEPLSAAASSELGIQEADVAAITLELGLWWGAIGTRAGAGYRRLARRSWKQALDAARETRDPAGNRIRVLRQQAMLAYEQGHRLNAWILRLKEAAARIVKAG
jgi:glycosyltransferase involved in cell wall biosynthesis